MASSPKFASLFFFFFFFTTLLVSLQIQARDSQIFNDVARSPDPSSTNPKSNAEEPSIKENEVDEEEPSFLPQTAGTGYGLYGHETGLDPPTTTTTTSTNNEIANHHDQKNYATELKGLSINGFSDGTPTKNDFDSKKNDNNIHGGERKYDYNYKHYHGGVGYNGGVEKQGMSDTRYMDNGQYFYDIDQAEKNKFDDQHSNDHFYQSNYKPYHKKHYNYHHKDGYFRHFDHGNDNYGEFNYNNKNYRNGDSMQRGYYQNQMQQDEELDFDP